MDHYTPFIISFLIGYFLLHLFFTQGKRPSFFIHLFLAGGVGLGLSAHITFLSFLIFNQLNLFFVKSINILLLLSLFISYCINLRKTKTLPFKNFPFKDLIPILILALIAIPLWKQSFFYAFGGWDAWSTWNFKAKFLFLGGEHWKNIFKPVLWRTSPHYPLLLPLINVWGWTFTGEPVYKIPVLTSLCFTFLTIGLLFSGLKKYTNTYWAFLPAAFLLTNPFLQKLSLSQYSDGALGYYLLAGILCLILAKTEHCKISAFVGGLLTGFLSFTKSEGLIAAIFLIILSFPYILWKNKNKNKWPLIYAFLIASGISFIPTILLKVLYSPGNQTFINGLTSTDMPSRLIRLKTTLGFYLIEMYGLIWNIGKFLNSGNKMTYIEMKWCSVWVVLLGGFLLANRKCFKKELIIIPFFLMLYGGTFTFYYYLNTYFKIEWWLQVTLNRVLSALLPSILFWIFWAMWKETKKEQRKMPPPAKGL